MEAPNLEPCSVLLEKDLYNEEPTCLLRDFRRRRREERGKEPKGGARPSRRPVRPDLAASSRRFSGTGNKKSRRVAPPAYTWRSLSSAGLRAGDGDHGRGPGLDVGRVGRIAEG